MQKRKRDRIKSYLNLIILILLICLIAPAPVFASDQVVKFFIGVNKYLLNGQQIPMDAKPYISQNERDRGRTYVPFRYVAEALGIPPENIIWDEKERWVTLIQNNKVVDFGVEVHWYLLNGKTIPLYDAWPQLHGDRFYFIFQYVLRRKLSALMLNGTTKPKRLQ